MLPNANATIGEPAAAGIWAISFTDVFLTLDRLSAWYFNKAIVSAQQTEGN